MRKINMGDAVSFSEQNLYVKKLRLCKSWWVGVVVLKKVWPNWKQKLFFFLRPDSSSGLISRKVTVWTVQCFYSTPTTRRILGLRDSSAVCPRHRACPTLRCRGDSNSAPPGASPPTDIHAVFHYSHKTRLSRCSRMYPGHSTCHPHPPQSDGYSGDKINWGTRPGVTLWCLNLGRSDISHRFRFVNVSPYRVFHVWIWTGRDLADRSRGISCMYFVFRTVKIFP